MFGSFCRVVCFGALLFAVGSGTAMAQSGEVDVEDVRADLSDDGVAFALGASTAEEPAVVGAVDDARADGLELSVVVLGAEAGDLPSLAAEVRGSDPGTVLVLSPDSYGANSGELGQRELDEATAAIGLGSNADAVRAFADEATAPGFPWLWLVVGIVLAAIGLVVVGRIRERKRRAQRAADALDAKWQELKSDINGLADDVLELEPHVPLLDDEKLRDEFAAASADYTAVRSRLERPVDSRGEAQAIEERIGRIRERLGQVRNAVDN